MQIGGLVSGIDTTTLVEQLIGIERKPIIQMNSRISTWKKQKDAWRDINTRVDTLNKRIAELQKLSLFQAQKVTSGDDKIGTATSTGGAIGGTYDLKVNNLATATTVQSGNPISKPVDPNVALNSTGFAISPTSGTFSINGVQITIDSSTESLNDVINKINVSGAGVTASYDSVNDKLSLTSGSAIQLGSGADTSNFLYSTQVISQTGGTDPTTVTSSTKLGATKVTANLQSAGFNTAFSMAAGSFSINGVEFTYDTSTDSLDSIIKKVNESNANVVMSFDSVNQKLVLQSKKTGSLDIALNDITGNFLAVTELTAGSKSLGKNANYTLNGTTLTSTSNSISGVVEGLTFELKSLGQTSINVVADPESTITKIKEFVEQYNSVQSFMTTKLAKGGDLQGDASLINLQSSLRYKTSGMVEGLSTDYKMLADVGINTDKSGILTIDETKLKEALNEKSYSVFNLFNDTNGVATRLKAELEQITESGTGILSLKQKTYDNQIKDTNKRIEIMEERLERRKSLLLKQFASMEQAMSKFTNQGAWLDSQLKSLSGWNTNSGQ